MVNRFSESTVIVGGENVTAGTFTSFNTDINCSASSPADELYGMDGYLSTRVYDSDNNGAVDASTDSAHLYAGMRRGGRNYYALDVTSKNSPELLWKITGGEGSYSELAQTWSRLVNAKMIHPSSGEVIDVLVFSGGYDDSQDDLVTRDSDTMGRAIFIADANTGELVWSAGIHDDASLRLEEMKFSVPATPAVVDIDGDGFFDQIYTADSGGQIFRFDFPRVGDITGGLIADFSSEDIRFFASPDVALFDDISDNTRYLMVSIGSGTRSRPLESEKNAFFAIKQSAVNHAPDDYGYKPEDSDSHTAITYDQLVDITENLIDEGNEEEQNEISLNLRNNHGWYVSMERSGEKIFNTSVTIDSKVIFTSYVPGAQSACTLNPGTNYLHLLDLSDGSPALDNNGDNKFEKSDRSIPLNADGISAPPAIIFTTDANGDTDVSVIVGTETTPLGEIELSQRTFWTETPEF